MNSLLLLFNPKKLGVEILGYPKIILPIILLLIVNTLASTISFNEIALEYHDRILYKYETKYNAGEFSSDIYKDLVESEDIDYSCKEEDKWMYISASSIKATFKTLVYVIPLYFIFVAMSRQNTSFKHFLSLVCYTGLVLSLGFLIQSFMARATGTYTSSNLGPTIFMANQPFSLGYKILKIFDIFPIIRTILIGFALPEFVRCSPTLIAVFLIIIHIATGFITGY